MFSWNLHLVEKTQSTEKKLKITDRNKSWKAISRVIDKGKMTRKDIGGGWNSVEVTLKPKHI